jgi:hypothetical protein
MCWEVCKFVLVAGFWLLVPGSLFLVSGSGFRVAGGGLRVAGCGWRIVNALIAFTGFYRYSTLFTNWQIYSPETSRKQNSFSRLLCKVWLIFSVLPLTLKGSANSAFTESSGDNFPATTSAKMVKLKTIYALTRS